MVSSSTKTQDSKSELPRQTFFAGQRTQVDLIDIRYLGIPNLKFIWHGRDHFSKYSMLFPLEDDTDESVAHMMIMYLSQGLTPVLVQTGNGKQFKSDLFKENLEQFNVVHVCETSTLGSIKRANQDVKTIISKFYTSEPEKYLTEKDIKQLCTKTQYSMNSGVTRATGRTPFELYFRRDENYINILRGNLKVAKNKTGMDLDNPEIAAKFSLIMDELSPIDDHYDDCDINDINDEPQLQNKTPNKELGYSDSLESAIEHGLEEDFVSKMHKDSIEYTTKYIKNMKRKRKNDELDD